MFEKCGKRKREEKNFAIRPKRWDRKNGTYMNYDKSAVLPKFATNMFFFSQNIFHIRVHFHPSFIFNRKLLSTSPYHSLFISSYVYFFLSNFQCYFFTCDIFFRKKKKKWKIFTQIGGRQLLLLFSYFTFVDSHDMKLLLIQTNGRVNFPYFVVNPFCSPARNLLMMFIAFESSFHEYEFHRMV